MELTSTVNPCRVDGVRVAKEPGDQTKKLYEEVGRRIRTARVGRGVTQDALAERVGLTRTSITNVEAGKQKLPLHTLFEIAAALQVEVRELLPASAGSGEEVRREAAPRGERQKALLEGAEAEKLAPWEQQWVVRAERPGERGGRGGRGGGETAGRAR